ncbi:hypothetical protein [Bradyrhizobium sp. ORS 375]|uniref:hypothetical protein n=1 Tax=Bradyrhizobium sp. (strain ORS 375) TaxID=566679 RepID=UPI001FCAB415|nr:hypothetical protein [Bradyrhizobium sp. ORS 375]
MPLSLLRHARLGHPLEGIEDAFDQHPWIALEQTLATNFAVSGLGRVVVQQPAEIYDISGLVADGLEDLNHIRGGVHRSLEQVTARLKLGRALLNLAFELAVRFALRITQGRFRPAPFHQFRRLPGKQVEKAQLLLARAKSRRPPVRVQHANREPSRESSGAAIAELNPASTCNRQASSSGLCSKSTKVRWPVLSASPQAVLLEASTW